MYSAPHNKSGYPPPVIKEVPVVDNTKLELLTNQNEELEHDLSEYKEKANLYEKRCSEIEKESEEMSVAVKGLELRVSQLQETVERLEGNVSNLESENQVLRQQALVASTNEDLSEQMKILESKIAELESENESLRNQAPVIVQQIVPSEIVPSETLKTPRAKDIENGHSTKEELKRTKDLEPVDVSLHKQKSLTDKHQENHDALIKCLMEDKRFDKDRPAAACIVYKSLLQWRSFEADKTHIFDRIIHTIRSSVEDQENINELAYWLSTTSTLLFLLQNTIKASNTASPISHRSRNSPTTLFSRMAQGLRSSPTSMGISSGYSGMVGKPEKSRIEAKYPALLFKQHLTAHVEKIYGMIRDSLKKEISSFLNLCIQAPRSARVRLIKGSTRNMHSSIVAKQQASSIHWQSIVQRILLYTAGYERESCSVFDRAENLQPGFLHSLMCSFLTVYYFVVNAARLAMVNMSKLVYKNWNSGAQKQQRRYVPRREQIFHQEIENGYMYNL
ncbi:hypothetical protein ACHQM5_016465 [Ranunculus cassubicifolius]